ncbi:MAG TPA: STAS domain-containing protein [Actinomycetota bacterium]|nr:STAS domain-containing protein [Actinomycetota bacterium]
MSFGPHAGPIWWESRKETAVVLVINASITPRDLPELCELVRALLAGAGSTVVCDVRALDRPDLCTVDALARLQLAVKRLGGSIRLCGATPQLQRLLELTGLGAALGLEVAGQAEQREQALGVEEEADARDLAPREREDL